jgi:5S rRNA maturation endonuclease (ribonuclease M5)
VTAFSAQFLDDLRARLPVSEIVGRTIKLKKKGSEFVGLSPFQTEKSPSFTVNDQKGFYHDFSSGKHGDIFSFLMETSGIDFRAAVVECAQVAGIPLPDDAGAPAQRNGSANGKMPHDDIPFDSDAYGAAPEPRQSSKREITKAYDYTDGAGTLLYQVCRIEWDDAGKHKKTFMQRRPDGAGHWIWGLSGGEFIRGRDGDWYQATEDRIQKWTNAARQHFPIGVSHGLYRIMELREEAGDDTPVYLPEGEKDVETLRAMGLSSTTNSGGARNWRADHAEQLRGRDIVILLDNDEPGRERGDIIARSLHGIARRIRLADFSEVWPDAPKGADVTDWVRQREGTVEELEEIVGRSPDWRPPPFVSQFGGIAFEQLDEPGPEHAHVIDGLITVGDKSVLAGPSQSGKSFLAIDMAMCIATGKAFFGRKIMTPGLVIYQAGEGGRGIKKRFRAWRQHFEVPKNKRVPLYILQSKVDIHSHEGDTVKLIAEIQGIARMYGLPVIAIFIDTLQKAQGMADENSGRDMGTVMANVDRIAAAVPGCHVCLVHHMNAGGTKLRGHTSVYAGVDQVILVTKDPETRLRTAVLDKQKDEEDGAKILFELMQVEIGKRPVDGKPITSCVALPLGGQLEMKVAGKSADRTVNLSNQQKNILTALKNALAEHGEPTPATLKLPRSITTVVDYKWWMLAYRAIASETDDAAVRQAMKRAGEKLYSLRIIGRINPYVWLTGRATIEVPFDAQGDMAAAQTSATQEEFPDQGFDR